MECEFGKNCCGKHKKHHSNNDDDKNYKDDKKVTTGSVMGDSLISAEGYDAFVANAETKLIHAGNIDIKLALHAGFCFGVKEAVKLVEHVSTDTERCFTYGEIIHNPQVVKRFSDSGVGVIEEPDAVGTGDTVIIRSHGICYDEYEALRNRGVSLKDATCPFVSRLRDIGVNFSKEGYSVVVYGERFHPEVKGVTSFIFGEKFIVENIDEALALPHRERYALISQTTQEYELFSKISDIVRSKCDDFTEVNTICNATQDRQHAAKELAKEVDLMIIIGGKKSGNTQRLYEICLQNCSNSIKIETKEELKDINLNGIKSIGITAGASTPDYIIEDVCNYLLEVCDGKF